MGLLFPVLSVSLLWLVLLPAAALGAAAALAGLTRLGGARFGRWLTLRYLLLVLPTLLPLAWAFSAALHLAEPGRSVLACLLAHDLAELCLEPLLLLLLLSAAVGTRALPLLRALRRQHGAAARPALERVEALVRHEPSLKELVGRVRVARAPLGGVVALGLVRPRVVLGADFVERCDDEALVGALAHELEHVRGLDPLRYLLLALCLRVNPAGEWLLGRHAAAWIFAREVQCDRAAVLGGAPAFGVARALLQASRPASPALAHIQGAPTKLRLRVELLLSYAERRPVDDVTRGPAALLAGALLLALALALPHRAGSSALDGFHTRVETLAARALH